MSVEGCSPVSADGECLVSVGRRLVVLPNYVFSKLTTLVSGFASPVCEYSQTGCAGVGFSVAGLCVFANWLCWCPVFRSRFVGIPKLVMLVHGFASLVCEYSQTGYAGVLLVSLLDCSWSSVSSGTRIIASCAITATSWPSREYTFATAKPRPCAAVGVSCTYKCH